jgi:hypothetical protein
MKSGGGVASGHWRAYLPMWIFPIACSAMIFFPAFDRHAKLYLWAVALPLLLICAAAAVIPLCRGQATWPQTLYLGGVLPLMIWTTTIGGLLVRGFWFGPMGRDFGALPSVIFGEDPPCKYSEKGFVFSVHDNLITTPDVEYTLCVRRSSKDGELGIMRQIRKGSVKTVTSHIPLDAHQYPLLVSLFETALDNNIRDDQEGLDGTTWCLASSRGGTDVRACFLAPSPEQAEKRGLDGLSKLAAALRQFEDRGT